MSCASRWQVDRTCGLGLNRDRCDQIRRSNVLFTKAWSELDAFVDSRLVFEEVGVHHCSFRGSLPKDDAASTLEVFVGHRFFLLVSSLVLQRINFVFAIYSWHGGMPVCNIISHTSVGALLIPCRETVVLP